MTKRIQLLLFGTLALTFSSYFLARPQLSQWSPLATAIAADDGPPLKLSDPLPGNLFIELAKAINPSVVNIYTSQLPRFNRGNYPRDPFFDLFEQFMGPQYQQRPSQSLGTGFIIREDGLIVTNNHVVADADIIKVQIEEKTKEQYEAKLIGRDPTRDIALIKINAKRKLPAVKLGASKDLQVGEWVAAFGNPFGHGHSVTKGIVSALGREIDDINILPFIQTDASINPGNSGGPLVNSKGLVIGVNAAIDARAQGIGFAIPIDSVKEIIPSLEKIGTVKRGFLGVYMADIDERSAKSLGLEQSEGALVTKVIAKSPAAKAGIQAYDLIVKFDGKDVSSPLDLSKLIARAAINQSVALDVIRNGKTKKLKLTIGEQPQEKQNARNEKRYQGQMAPYDFGFRLIDYNRSLAREMGLAPLNEPRPIVVEVQPTSPAAYAGLIPGDIIVDVNKKATPRAKDVISKLVNGDNVLLVLRGDRELLIHLKQRSP